MSSAVIQVLLIDDDAVQSFLIQDYLVTPANPGFELRTASTLAEGHRLLVEQQSHVLLLDLGLPDSTGECTFFTTQKRFPQLPIVVMTGLEDENVGLELVHAGAQDYLVKSQLSAPLVCRALRYAIERKQLVLDLEQALVKIKTLTGLLPICAGCKQIRDTAGQWTPIETYIAERSDASFSHGLCPKCSAIYFPGVSAEPESK